MPTSRPLAVAQLDTMASVSDSYTRITFGPWVFRVDVTDTRHCYERLKSARSGGERGCDCDPCRNFAVVEDDAYPDAANRLFDDLGIDRKKPFELSHYSRMPSGLHLYGGWHYFCGSVESGPTSLDAPHRVSPTFQIAVKAVDAPREPFPKADCIQLDFYTEVPWKLALPEPE